MSGYEEFTEYTDIREAIDSIYDMLADLPKKERLGFFEQISKPKDLDFVKEIGGIYYVVCSHFDKEETEDMVEYHYYKHHIRLSERSYFEQTVRKNYCSLLQA